MTGSGSDNVFKIRAPRPTPSVTDFGMVVLLLLTAVIGVIVIRNRSWGYQQ